MSARSIGWHAEHDLEERRRVRNATFVSIGIHVSLFAALVISPPVSYERMPQAISVELIAGPQMANPAPAPSKGRPQPKTKAPAPEPPAEAAPEPPPPAPTPPPPSKAPVAVLPENAPKPDKKVKQAPEKTKPQEVAKADTKPAEKPVKKKPAEKPAEPKEEAQSYEDVMKSLDEELGEDETADLLEAGPARPQNRTGASSGATESSSGVQLRPEDAAWMLATKRRIQSKWVTPPTFRNRGLQTWMEIQLSASGEVIGEPVVMRSSGDPYFDDNAVRAVLSSSPLPAPPRPGKTSFLFSSEEN